MKSDEVHTREWLCDTDDSIELLSCWSRDFHTLSDIFPDESASERGFVRYFVLEDIGFLRTHDHIGDLLIFERYHYRVTDVDTRFSLASSRLFSYEIIATRLEYLFEFGDAKLDLCLLIASFLVFSVLREITIGDRFLELRSDIDTFLFAEEPELFLKFSESVTGEEDFLIRHRREVS